MLLSECLLSLLSKDLQTVDVVESFNRTQKEDDKIALSESGNSSSATARPAAC